MSKRSHSRPAAWKKIPTASEHLQDTLAGGWVKCRRYTAKSSHTEKKCKRPASKLSKTSKCSRHGGLTTGPKTKEGKDCIRAAYLKHGEETLEAKVERNSKSLIFKYLTDLDNHCSMFHKKLKTQGRTPSVFTQLDFRDQKNLVIAILWTYKSHKY